MLLLTDLLYQQKDNLKVAIRHGEFSLTYEKWFMESTLVSKRLKSINSQENINVILFFPNSINYAIGYFAILLASKVVIPLGTNSKQAEILSVLRYAEISSVVTSEEYKVSA